ncbi:MAG: DUF1186 domain-containing protein [Verrucomicrobiota bacterium]
MNFEPDDLLDKLATFEEGVFPREILTEIIERREEFAGPLLNALDDIQKFPMEMVDEGAFFPVYVVYLLAQFREKRAWKPLLEILALPGEIPDQLFGDSITEGMGNILASLYDGSEQELRDLIENPDADEYVRGATGIDTYLTLLATEQIGIESLETYFGELLESRLERNHSFVWDALATACANLGFKNLLPIIEKAFSEGLCDPCFNGLKHIKKTMESVGSDDWRSNAELIDDTISELSDWVCFKPQPKSTKPTTSSLKDPLASLPSFRALQPVRIEPAAGRNDPCPCGSGKKYKKCCGNEAAKPR